MSMTKTCARDAEGLVPLPRPPGPVWAGLLLRGKEPERSEAQKQPGLPLALCGRRRPITHIEANYFFKNTIGFVKSEAGFPKGALYL